jgi:PKD repeat protein
MRLLAALTGALMLGAACGDDGPTGANTPPVANFTQTCVGRACTFDDTSTDDQGISSRSWTFADPTSGNNNSSSTENPSHTFTANGAYDVTLTVTDAQGETSAKTTTVTVTNAPPAAAFTNSCNGGECTFTNTTADPEGSTFTSAWDFGDPASGNNTATTANGAHSYTVTAVTDFTVTLTVTDAEGGTDVETQTITINPPAGLECAGVECTLDLTSRSTVTITITAADCQFVGNAFAITAPIQETVFTDGCSLQAGTVFNINGGAAFNAGTSLEAQFTQGAGGPNDPEKGPPATRVTGAFPDWTVEFDDGGDPTGIGGPEPDFNDIVLAVHATVVP